MITCINDIDKFNCNQVIHYAIRILKAFPEYDFSMIARLGDVEHYYVKIDELSGESIDRNYLILAYASILKAHVIEGTYKINIKNVIEHMIRKLK